MVFRGTDDSDERRLLRVSHERDDDSTLGGVQERNAACHGKVGQFADERSSQLRGAAGQDVAVRQTDVSSDSRRRVRWESGSRERERAHGVLTWNAFEWCSRRGFLSHARLIASDGAIAFSMWSVFGRMRWRFAGIGLVANYCNWTSFAVVMRWEMCTGVANQLRGNANMTLLY